MDENRIKHSLEVANKMMKIGKEKNLSDKQLRELFVLGINHDIGYEFGNNENHNLIGSQIMQENGYKYWKEIHYHGKIQNEYSSLYLDILNSADMQIDRYGKDVGYDKRLEDIKNRYGKESFVYKEALMIIEKLKEK